MNTERNMNNKVDDKWLKNLRERMEDYSEPLPDGLWKELEGELNQPKVIPFWRRWPSVAAAVAVVLVVNSLVFTYWLAPQMEEENIRQVNQLAVETAGKEVVPIVEVPVGSKSVADAKEDAQLVAKMATGDVQADGSRKLIRRASSKSGLSTGSENIVSTEAVAANYTDGTEGAFSASDSSLSDTSDSSSKNQIADKSQGQIIDNEAEKEMDEVTDEKDVDGKEQGGYRMYRSSARACTTADAEYLKHPKRTYDNGGLEFGLHTGGIPYASSKEFNGMGRMLSYRMTDFKSPIVMGSLNSKMTPYNQVLFSNRDKKTTTDVKHHMPINVVASVKWHFAEKWALESGLSYTFLQSELHSGSELYWEDTQKLHYVGIPIKIHRDIWDNDFVAFYASAGGMLEKCVSGSLESVYVTGDSEREVEHHSVHSHPFQGSLSAALGAQMKLIRSLSLFVEPGVAYYFDDNSALETIRKEHPLNFNLQFGLRFSLNN